jgi:hypothetical protein
MEKLSNEQVAELLSDASQTIREQNTELQALREKVAGMELKERAEKIASSLHEKGSRLDTPREELVAELEKEAAAGHLDAIEKAVELIGPDMWKHARAGNPNSDAGGGTGSPFETYILAGS